MLGAAILFVQEYREGRATQERDTIQTARALARAVDNQIMQVHSLARGLATADSLARRDFAMFHKQARRALERSSPGVALSLSERTGKQLLNTAREFGSPLPRHGNPEIVHRVIEKGEPAVSDLFIGGVTGRPVLVVAVPVVIEGKVAYAMTISILPEDLKNILSAQDLPSGWVATILDSASTIVTRSRESEKYSGQKPAVEFLQRRGEANEGALEFVMKDGVSVVSHFTRSPVTGWTVAINIPLQVLEAQAMRRLSWMAVGIAALFALGLSLAFFMANRIARSFRVLRAPALALGAGESVHLPSVDVTEAAEVAHAIGEAAKLMEERTATLRTKEAELAEAQRLAKLGSWYWDAETDTNVVSEELLRIYGIHRIPNFAEQNGTLYPSDTWQELNAAVQEAVRSGTGYDLILPALRGGGTPIWVNTRCEAVRNCKGQVIALRGTVQDLTARKEAEIALERERASHREQLMQMVAERTAELMAANRELEGFTFATSHDLRGPLGRINSFSTLLDERYREHLEGEGRLFISFIRQNATRLIALVDDLLSHARVAQQPLELQALNMSALAQAVLQEMDGEIREAGALVKLELPSGKVLGDQHALNSALSNLLENALKYAATARPPVIEIGGQEAGGQFRLWVRDNGIGFDMAYHDRIFEIFRRLHTYDQYRGSGVGLALVKRAMERMSGKVWAESQPGQGATFFLELQVATDPASMGAFTQVCGREAR